MLDLFDKTRWIQNRNNYLKVARETRTVLTNPEGHWRYNSDDQRVKNAMASWVDRARNAHAFALGRKPVIRNAYIVRGPVKQTGSLFAA